MRIDIPDIFDLWRSIPEEDRPQGNEEVRFWQTLAWELSNLFRYAKEAQEPTIFMDQVRVAKERHNDKEWRQYQIFFSVSDLAKPWKSEWNWHLQNTSQWCYAGAITIDCPGSRVSSNH